MASFFLSMNSVVVFAELGENSEQVADLIDPKNKHALFHILFRVFVTRKVCSFRVRVPP